MKRTVAKLVSCVLSVMLVFSCGLTALASDYFVDNVISEGANHTLTVANLASTGSKTFNFYSAKFEGNEFKVVKSDSVTVEAGNSAELTTELDGATKHMCWDDNFKPYNDFNKSGGTLPAPSDVAGPDRGNAAEHRTKAYTSFTLTWTPDTTGAVDHYEVYEDGNATKLGETKNGYFIVYNAEPNADKKYYVKAVSKGGVEVSSTPVEAGSLYMNKIDLSDVVSEELTPETDYDVTYTNMATPDASVATYATDKDAQLQSVTTGWAGDGKYGMKVYSHAFPSDKTVIPVRVTDKNGVTKGAYKSFWARSGSDLTSKNYNYMHFSLNSDWLKANKNDETPVSNVTFEYDYLDNGAAIYGRVKTNTNQYLGAQINGNVAGGTDTWKTSTKAIDDFHEFASAGYGVIENVDSPIRINSFDDKVITAENNYTVPAMYISAVRGYMTDRAGTTSSTDDQYVYQRYQDAINEGVTMGNYHGAKIRTGTDAWGSYWQTTNSATPAEGETTVEEPNHRIGVSIDDNYLGKYDNEVTIVFDYMYNSQLENHFVIKYTTSDGTIKDFVTEVPVVYGWNNNKTGEFRKAVIQMPDDFSAINKVVGDQGIFDFAIGKQHNTNMNNQNYSYLCIKNIYVYNTTADHIR